MPSANLLLCSFPNRFDWFDGNWFGPGLIALSSLWKNESDDRFDGIWSLLVKGFSDGRSNSEGIFVVVGLEKRLVFGRWSWFAYFDSRRLGSSDEHCFDSDLICGSRDPFLSFKSISLDVNFWSIGALSISSGKAGGGCSAFSGNGGGGGGACINSAMMLSEMFVASVVLEWNDKNVKS